MEYHYAPAIPPQYPPPPQLTSDSYYLHYQPQPMAPTMTVAATNSDIHTVFISGLPDDIKAREIHNLFRRRPGFDSCLLEYTGRGNQVVAFATFFSHQAAVTAMAELDGMPFDRETGATLHVELARSNSRRRPRDDGGYDIIDKRTKLKHDEYHTRSNDGSGGYDEPSGTENDFSSKKGALSAAQSGNINRKTAGAQATENDQLEKPSSDDIQPCSTLFIANLSPTFTEEELTKILSECRGFEVLKMRRKGGKPCAFADFSDVEASTEAKEKLLGTSHGAADDDGLHLEYARSKMRKT